MAFPGTSYTGLDAMRTRALPNQTGKRKGPPICYRPKQPVREALPSDGTMKFTVIRQMKESFESLNQLRMSNRLCDVSLSAGGKRFPCHKVVLASASPYFNAMFKGGMIECCKKEVDMKHTNISPSTLSIILDFIYTTEVCVTESTVCDLMQAAMMLQMPHVIEACSTFLEHQLDPTNCIGIRKFAHQYDCLELEKKAKRYILKRFSEVRHTEEFLTLVLKELTEILKAKEMTVRCESEVYMAVLNWVSHDVDSRGRHLLQLLENVRLGSIPPEFIQSQLKHCRILQRVPDKCVEKLNQRFKELQMHICTAVEAPRDPCEKQVIYCIGGYLNASVRNVEYYNPQDNNWRRIADLPYARSGLAACTILGHVYAVGGRNNSRDTPNEDQSLMDSYNPKTSEWTRLPSMHSPRNRVAVAVLDNKLYAAGGSNAAEGLQSVECYDPLTREWTVVASMSTKRIAAGLAVVNRFLYAVGGSNGQVRLSTMEKYYPEENRWIRCPPMSTIRSGAGVCGLGFHIYVAGGFDSSTQLNTVERFDTRTETWEMVAPMRYPRSALSLVNVKGKLYALGGYGGNMFVPAIESYDPESNTWNEVSQMQTGKSGQGVTVGPLPDAVM